MVENLLSRAQAEMRSGNDHPGVQISTKMYTIAIDAWAKSKQGVKAAQRAEEILQYMDEMYKSTKNENLRPTTGMGIVCSLIVQCLHFAGFQYHSVTNVISFHLCIFQVYSTQSSTPGHKVRTKMLLKDVNKY